MLSPAADDGFGGGSPRGRRRRCESRKKSGQYALALFSWMEALGVNIDKVTAVTPSSMTQNIKQYISSVDGVLDAADMVGGLAGAAIGIASA